MLGNGFSMGVHAAFGYRRLYDEALRVDPSLSLLFEGCGTDFEAAIRSAEEPEARVSIRSGLVEAISRVHPRRKFLSPEACESCGRFLEDFAGVVRAPLRGSVFTTNYDLLLYWVLMQRQTRLKLYDGFDNEGIWDDARLENSFVFYLHGALHHYERNIGKVRRKMRQYKLLYEEGDSIVLKVRAHITAGHLPVFVAEGSSPEKQLSISRNLYLRKVGRRFEQACNDPEATLFTVGQGLAEVDEHITDRIGAGSAAVYIGVYAPLDDGSRARELARSWACRREALGQPALEVKLFDSAACPIWKPAPEAISPQGLA